MSIRALTRYVYFAGILLFSFGAFSVAQVPGADANKGPNPRVPCLREGLVFTSTWSAMSHAGHAMDFKQDDRGGWIATDGTRLEGMDRPSTSAGGISQTVVTCIDGDKVFLASHAFTDMRALGYADPVPQGKPTTFVVGIAGCDLWVEPARLAQMRSDPSTHTVVQSIQWKRGDQSSDAVRVTAVGSDHYIDHIFDRATGICLHAAESSTAAAGQLKYLAPGDTAAGDTQLSQFDLLNVRDVNTPWAGEPMPPWASQFKTLHYRGEIRPANPFLGRPTELGLDVSRLDSGNGWFSTTTAGYVLVQGEQRFPTKGIYISGRDQFDGFFAGPAALAKMQQGDVLDNDPVTHMQTSVTSADSSSVTIMSANSCSQMSRTFDRQTGKLLAFTSSSALTKMPTSFQLQGEE